MKRVLSIDLDYIMGPSDNLYRDIGWHNHPFIRWDMLYRLSGLKKEELRYCKKKLEFLKDLFLKSIENCKNIKFAYEHDSILYHISDYDSIDLINIDHHDDVLMFDYTCYDEDFDNLNYEYYHTRKFNRVDEGNWISWLHNRNKLNSLTWIGNKNSFENSKQFYIKRLLKDYTFVFKNYDKVITDYNFDHIFICLSPQYIPPHHWNIMNWFIEKYEEHTNTKLDINEFQNKKFELDNRYTEVTNSILNKTAHTWSPEL